MTRRIPTAPPREWFDDPRFDAATPLRVDAAGRVSGHLALWDSCHRSYRDCKPPPTSASGYRSFRTGAVRCADGTEVATGVIFAGTDHASLDASAAASMSHYSHTGRALADVAAGEDRYGVWVAGALRPGVTGDQVRVLRASPLSGDWRPVRGALELVAVLAVNSPGYEIPRAIAASAGGAVVGRCVELTTQRCGCGCGQPLSPEAVQRRQRRRSAASARTRVEPSTEPTAAVAASASRDAEPKRPRDPAGLASWRKVEAARLMESIDPDEATRMRAAMLAPYMARIRERRASRANARADAQRQPEPPSPMAINEAHRATQAAQFDVDRWQAELDLAVGSDRRDYRLRVHERLRAAEQAAERVRERHAAVLAAADAMDVADAAGRGV